MPLVSPDIRAVSLDRKPARLKDRVLPLSPSTKKIRLDVMSRSKIRLALYANEEPARASE